MRAKENDFLWLKLFGDAIHNHLDRFHWHRLIEINFGKLSER